jgi:fucose permease
MREHPHIVLIIMAYVAFIALGMPDGLLGVAWPSIRTNFSVPLDSVGLLLSAVVIGYLISSISSGPLVARFGVGNILAWSCALTGAGLIGYTLVPYWWMVILLGIVSGLGAGAIDAGLNAYAVANFNEGLMQWLHASYGIGVTIGPILMTSALTFMNSWRVGYIIVGGFQILLSICFVIMLPIWNQKKDDNKNKGSKLLTDYKTPLNETFRQSRVWLSILLFFLYTGSEISLGTWAYILLIDSRGINPELAGLLVGSYWAAFTVGRIFAGLTAKLIGMNRLVTYSLIAAFLGALLLWWNPLKIISLSTIPVIGLAIAPIFPALVFRTSERVGIRFSANSIGMQMAAGGLGAAIVPSIVGILARRISLEFIPICMIILFLVLLGLHSLSVYSIPKTLNTYY